jgi:hypothetical protein
MSQTNPDRVAEFIAFWPINWAETKRAAPFGFCPVYDARVGAQVALQRCPILRTSTDQSTMPFLQPVPKGTFLLCIDRIV